MKSIVYILGTLVLTAGILYGAWVAGVPQTWLIVIGLVIAGLGIMGAARSAATTTTAVEKSSGPSGPQVKETKVSSD